MYQRSPVYVINIQTGCAVLCARKFDGLAFIFRQSQTFCLAYAEDGPPLEIADRIAASLPFPMLKMLHQGLVQVAAAIDK